MKKLVSLGLALVMCLALMIPALASEQSFETENSALTPTIEVEMPASASVILNPYGMTYKGGILGNANATSQAQIISNVFNVTNKTEGCNLEVQAKVTGVVAGSAQLVALNDSGLEADNSQNAVAAIGKKFKSTGNQAEKGNKVCMALTYNFTGAVANAAPSAMGGTWTAAHTKIVTESEQDLDTIVLPPAVSGKYTYVTYQFSGVAVSKPTEPWTENDAVGASFVFTFTATPDAVTTAS